MGFLIKLIKPKPKPMFVTATQFRAACPENKNSDAWVPLLNEWLSQYGITHADDVAMFLAQTGHESAGYTRLSENLNYSAAALQKTWPTRYNATLAAQHARKPETIANHVYQGRMGNTKPGDGYRFRGSGIIQTTGRDNHTEVAKHLGMTAEAFADLNRTDPKTAIRSACFYWRRNNLSAISNIETVTRRINGGLHGLEDRKARYIRIKNAR